MGRLADREIRTIGFTRSRRAAELLAEFARREVAEAATRERIKSYRAGYLAEDRRRIERELADGDLLAIASTSALELGIDIGSLDAAVLTGYPGTRASMWQQVGRAGRRDTDALAILVAQDDPLDQYLVHHPARPVRTARRGRGDRPDEPLRPRAASALRREGSPAPRTASSSFFGEAGDVRAAVDRMVERGELVARKDAWHDRGKESPHRAVDVRAGGGHVYSIVIAETGELLGTADEHRAYATLHPGRGLPAHGRAVSGRRTRPGAARRRRDAGRPRLLHAGARRHRHRGGRDRCAVNDRRRRPVLRRASA